MRQIIFMPPSSDPYTFLFNNLDLFWDVIQPCSESTHIIQRRDPSYVYDHVLNHAAEQTDTIWIYK